MSNRSGHTPDLAILAFDQNEFEPDVRNIFPKADGRVTRWNFRLRLQNSGGARERFILLDGHPFGEMSQCLGTGDALDLRPIRSFVALLRVQEPFTKSGFIAQQEQTFGVGIEPAERIDRSWKTEFGQSAVGRTIRRELREHPVWFVEGEQHSKRLQAIDSEIATICFRFASQKGTLEL